MKPERYQEIEELYHSALGRKPEERAAFLEQSCGADEALRGELESLLGYDERAEQFIETPPDDVAAAMLAAEQKQSMIGRTLGHYRIVSLLGSGGMGEVYVANDPRLNRRVALKLLPAGFTADRERLRRFEQEARAASALNHPNILTVYEFGEHDGSPYIVSELLEGEELREQLIDGALSQRKAVDYAQQIAAGLAAAHAKGIVHRDLKPENIFINTDGRVKILDFGLAKLRPQRSGPLGSDVATQKAMTEPGTVMGTVGYMSPEQVRGQEADHRVDIFAFGVILCEMLSGRRPFPGESAIEVMNAILKEEPAELSETNQKISPSLERIVRRCLEKKPEQRFQSASDLGFALEALSISSASSGANQTEAMQAAGVSALIEPGNWRDRIAWLVAGLAVLAALGMAYFGHSDGASGATRAVRLSFAPPENLAFDNGRHDYVIVSPDGRILAFTGRAADGKRQLWVRPLDAVEAQPLPGTDDALEPFWSPDSRSIGFVSQGKLKRVELAGGRPQPLCDVDDRMRGATWGRAGVIIFSKAVGGLFQIPAGGGEARPVTSPDSGRQEFHHYDPWFLPDGRHFLYRVNVRGQGDQQVSVGSLDSKEVKPLLADGAPAAYAPPGWLLFVRNGALLAQSFDADRLELKGDPFPITRPTNIRSVPGRPFSVSENGVLIWQGSRQREYQLVWFDRAGKQVGTVGSPIKVGSGQFPRLSPDGKRVAIQRTELQTLSIDIWVIDLARDLPTRLTSDPAFDWYPIWSPDGSRIVFRTERGGVYGLYQKSANGVGTEELLLKGVSDPTDWSPDGRFIFYNLSTEKSRRDIWALPLAGDRQPYPLLSSEFDEYRAQLSPDGHLLAYVSDESGSYEVYVQPFTDEGKLGGDKKRLSTGGGNHPRFRRGGPELYYVAPDGQMMAVALKLSGATFEFESPKALFKTRMLTNLIQSGIEYDVTEDGQRFLIGTQVADASPVSVILNWTAEVKR